MITRSKQSSQQLINYYESVMNYQLDTPAKVGLQFVDKTSFYVILKS